MVGGTTTTAGGYAAFQQQIGHGYELLRQGRTVDAAALGDRLLKAYPRNAEALYYASEVQLALEDPQAALGFISAAVEAAPGQFVLLIKQANLLFLLRRRADARRVADDAAKLAAGNPAALRAVGSIHGRCGDPAVACDFYEQALEIAGPQPALLYDLAAAEFFTGDLAKAEEHLDLLLAESPEHGQAMYLRSTLRHQTPERSHADAIEARLAAGIADDRARAAALYALAKEREDLEQPEASFAALTEAAALQHSTLGHDPAAELASIDSIRLAYGADVMNAEVTGHDEEGAIFIVGMPRTGTTLVDRMLDRHGEATSVGELSDFGRLLGAAVRKVLAADPGKTPIEATRSIDLAELGRDYMAAARELAPGSRMFVDKMPINYMYCGLIKQALPKAKLIHLVRDPMDTCYAVYKTLFNQAYAFSYDLDELGEYYATYHRLMRHWHAVMPGAILDVRYEDLVSDMEGQARRIIEWCGLEWQDAVLSLAANENPTLTASAAQVREPVHERSVGKWRAHAAGLAPLEARLVAAGIIARQDR